MRYAIIERGDDLSSRYSASLKQKLKGIGFVNDQETPEIVFTIGGDGTILKAVHHYIDQIDQVVVIGIHTGKLGFYTDFTPNEMDALIDHLKVGDYKDAKFPLLKADVCKEGECDTFYALNEVTLINSSQTQHLDVYINDAFFESFQGTGVCISTPSGSSAYNKSLGGALMPPQIEAFQFTEIASINNNIYRTISSPMIFPKGTELVLRSRDFKKVMLTVDHEHDFLSQYDEIRLTLSDRFVTFRQFQALNFWQRIQKAFL